MPSKVNKPKKAKTVKPVSNPKAAKAVKPVQKPKEEKAEKVTPKPFPVVEGRKVIAILNDGRETAKQYHCRMEDGTTRHVDKSLF